MAETKTRKKKFKSQDLISCKSFTNGKYVLKGKKSNIIYKWLSYGDIVEVEYQDLLTEVHAKKPSVFKPRIIILDNDFLEQNQSVSDLYNNMYTTNDLAEILKLSPSIMKKTIEELPDGAKDSLKSIASTKINNGSLDSIRVIKVLDEVFDTNMLFLLATE